MPENDDRGAEVRAVYCDMTPTFEALLKTHGEPFTLAVYHTASLLSMSATIRELLGLLVSAELIEATDADKLYDTATTIAASMTRAVLKLAGQEMQAPDVFEVAAEIRDRAASEVNAANAKT
jgi:hypothetical protein